MNLTDYISSIKPMLDPWHFCEDLDPDPAIFVIDLQDANKKLIKKKFFCLLLFEDTFTSFSKIKSPKEVTNQQESRVFLLFLLGDRWIRIQETPKHTDPTGPDSDQDPQHCYKHW